MSGGVRVFAGYDRDVYESCDAVVVGSGPAGAVVAKELAEAGQDVVLVEEGPPFTPQDFVLDGSLSMARTMRQGGLRTTRGGFVMPTMQAIALGGGSLVNSAICVRAPAATLDAWCERFALRRSTRADLDPHFEAVERFLGIAPTPDDVQGPRNLLFRDACTALGWSSEPIPRNVTGCLGSGECFTGCRARAKQSTDVAYVPAAVRAGARVLTSARVERVLHWGRRATGVAGRIVRPFGGEPAHRFRVDARVVVLAAGCLATPVLLQRSRLGLSSGQVGENLQFHPGVAIMGVFPEHTHPQFGATQGYQSLQFVERGFKLETLWAPPGVLAVRLPGFGFDLKANLARLPFAAIWDGFASCHRSLGRVRARWRGLEPAITWSLHPEDLRILGEALWALAQLFFAVGARAILPGVHRVADELGSLAEAEVLRTHDYRPTDLTCGGNHVFSTTRMHGDPRQGVVDEDGRCHGLDNLYVADTGILPRSPSVNPMLTAMALAHRIARGIAGRL